MCWLKQQEKNEIFPTVMMDSEPSHISVYRNSLNVYDRAKMSERPK